MSGLFAHHDFPAVHIDDDARLVVVHMSVLTCHVAQ
jgi:hypothetical protein